MRREPLARSRGSLSLNGDDGRVEHASSPASTRDPSEAKNSWDPTGARFAGGRVITGHGTQRLVLFTFDDGPDLRYTPALLEELDAAGIRAVFFVTASRLEGPTPWARRHRALVREIAARGHLVGSHTLDHVQLPLVSSAEVERQLDRAEALIAETVGARPWLFRPPGGARSPRTDALVEARGYTTVLWNAGAADARPTDARAVLETWTRVMARLERDRPGSSAIVLLHDTYPWTVEAFPRMVDYLRTRNCALLDTGEPLYDIVDDPSAFFDPRRAADEPGRLAREAALPPAQHEARQAVLRARARAWCEARASAWLEAGRASPVRE